MPKVVASQPPSRPRRPNASSRATPPTTGGRTIGSTVTARSTARPGKLSRARVQASGTPKTRAIAVADNEASSDRRSAVRTSGDRSWSQIALHGVRSTRPISGIRKNAAPIPASTSNATGAAGRTPAALWAGKAIAIQGWPAGAKEIGDKCLGQGHVLGILQDSDGIVGDYIYPGRDFHPLDRRAGRLDVGDVDDAGIRLAKRHLADDRLDVGLLASGVHGHASLQQSLDGVTPAWNNGGAEENDEARTGEVGEPRDVFRVPGPDDDLQTIVGKDRRRTSYQPGVNRLLHVALIRRREDVADGALLDLRDQR